MDDVFASVITYNPNIELLCENLAVVIPQVKRVVIIDNSSRNVDELEKNIEEKFKENVILKKNETNNGIAKALNQAFMYCENYKCNWLFTLDQDSICSIDIISKLYSCISSDVGIVGPDILYVNNENIDRGNRSNEEVIEVDWVITSASLTNVSAWKKIGGFDEKLFIDSVDYDFCYRLKKNGYKILKKTDIKLKHSLGKLKCRKIFKKIIYVTNHTPLRRYYMVRNVIYLDRKLKVKRAGLYILKLFFKILFFEDNKLDNIKNILKGVIDSRKL